MEIILVRILDLLPILGLLIQLRVMRHCMMLLVFIVPATTGSCGKVLVMEAMLEVFYLLNYMVGKIEAFTKPFKDLISLILIGCNDFY